MTSKKRKLVSRSLTGVNVVALGAVATLAVLALRENNLRSSELYNQLQLADETGVGVNEALAALQTHVASHMNASPLPQLGDNAPVQLSRSYDRAKAAESARVTAEREKVTQDGIAICEARYSSAQLTVRSQCIADYGAANPVQPERAIVVDLYRYDFVSPLWTPDKAGWLVVASLVLAGILVLRIVSRIVVSIFVKE